MKSKQIDSCKIGSTIKALRLANNLTQEQLADRIGYSVRNIRRIENNGTSSIDVVNYFAEIFEVSAFDILSETHPCGSPDQDVLFLLIKKSLKTSIVSFRHTILTLICYSHIRTLG